MKKSTLKSVTRLLFVTTQYAALLWVSISYLIALYATVRLGQVFPVVDLSKQAIETILGVNVLKVVENIFEHNNSPVFGTTNEPEKKTKRDCYRRQKSMDITTIIEAVFALTAAVITAIVIPYIKSRTTAQQQAEINAWVKIAVTAAEQIYRGSGRGEEKKAYVLNWLAEHGITLDEDRIDALIEAAVYELNHGVLKEGAGNE